jgi:phage recombination protein Bet
MAKAAPTEVARYVPNLTPEIVKKYINQNANEQEIYFFLELCKSQQLNPFMKEAFLIKYGQNDPASMVVAYQVFIKRAEKNPAYNGFKAGIIVLDANKQITYREGAFYLESEQILGGWCEVYRKDRSTPSRIEVAFNEYVGRKSGGEINKQWAGKPATMIRKVPIAQAHRDAFPDELGRLYVAEEFAADEDALPKYEMGKPPLIPVPEGMQGFRAPTQINNTAAKAPEGGTTASGAVGEGAGTAGTATRATETSEAASDAQVKKINVCLKEIGCVDDKSRHEYASNVLLKDPYIASINDLTKREASNLIEELVKRIAAQGSKK